jgi:hypothetical protein
MRIDEGLRQGDLEGMVLPLITIDEYASKIDDASAIVVGFYVFEEDAAHDLSNFLERTPHMVMDTDVSPAPTKDGYYVCFVEMSRSADFPESLVELLQDVSRLTKNSEWQFTTVKLPKDKIEKLSQQAIEKSVDFLPKSKESTTKTAINEFFRDSSLHGVEHSGTELQLTRRGVIESFELVGYSDTAPTGAMNLSESAASRCLRLTSFLGGPYSVHQMGIYTVVENWNVQKFLILTEK